MLTHILGCAAVIAVLAVAGAWVLFQIDKATRAEQIARRRSAAIKRALAGGDQQQRAWAEITLNEQIVAERARRRHEDATAQALAAADPALRAWAGSLTTSGQRRASVVVMDLMLWEIELTDLAPIVDLFAEDAPVWPGTGVAA